MRDLRLVAKGRRDSIDALIQQGRVSVKLARDNAEALSQRGGWREEDTDELHREVEQLDTDAARKADAFEISLGLTSREEAARDAAKAYIRKLRYALPRALEESPDSGLTMDSFAVGKPLRRSTPRLVGYLRDIRPQVVKLDAALARFFGEVPASVQLDEVKNALEAADSAQESALEALPDETQNVCERKGKVLHLIEHLNRSARIAFDGDATKIGQFNKDILLRARRARKSEPTDAPTDA